jgi:hypothetical protein
MKRIWITLLCLASSAVADDTSMYESVDAFNADLEQMAIRCGEMPAGKVEEEIFGLRFSRGSGDRCILGRGQIDPKVVAFFADHEISWAGLVDDKSIWVSAK